MAGLFTGRGGTDPAVQAGGSRCGGAAQRRLSVGPAEHGCAAHRWCWGDRAGFGVSALYRVLVPGGPGRGDCRRASDPVPARSNHCAARRSGQRRTRIGPAGGSRRRRGRTRPGRRVTAARAAESDLSAYSARLRLRCCAARHRAYLGRRDGALGGQNAAVSQHECAAIRPGVAMGPHPASRLDCRGRDRSDRESSALASRTEATGGEKIMTTLTSFRAQALRRFLRHYLEMIMAMVVGMVVLGAAEAMLLNRVGWAETLAQPEPGALIMA